MKNRSLLLWFALVVALILAGCKGNTDEVTDPCETNPTPDCGNYCDVYPDKPECQPGPPVEPPVEPPVACVATDGSDITETVGGLNMEMVFVKCGRMKLGCDDVGVCGELTAAPAFLVELSNYYIGKFEVTQRQWTALMDTNPSNFVGDDERPVERVSWDDAQAFITELNKRSSRKKYRLPTNAEWEYAARGGVNSNGYEYSGGNNVDGVAWYTDNSGGTIDGTTKTVGTKDPNELGLRDMSGNVWEWVNDRYGKYEREVPLGTPIVNPQGPETGTDRVIRGGGWQSDEKKCSVSARTGQSPSDKRAFVGFRVALSAE